ncbi:MAG TPA: aspartate--tRNA(Asn) ligase [Candidatus Saccharimonadales bacterium]
MRTLSSEVAKHISESIEVKGWLHKKRLLGGVTFINVRDRGGLVQVVIKDKTEVEKLRGLQIGTVLKVEGQVVEEPRAPGGAELHDAKLEVLVPVEFESPIEIDKPLSHESENLETLLDYRVVGLRNLREQAIFKVQAAVKEAARSYLRGQDFTEFNSPKLLPGATEGGAEVFKLDYFGKEATLAQSGQFYKQIMVGVFERGFEINPTYRAEPSATTRHMTEFMHIDAEMGFVDLEELLDMMSGLMNSVIDDVWTKGETHLKIWNAAKPLMLKQIPQITMAEIHEKYSASTGTNTVGEKDLRPDEERWICEWTKKELKSDAVFVTEWPREGAKFYHKFKDDDQQVAERADLLFRGVEIATASMREHRYDKLVTQLRGMAGGDPENIGFKYYLDAFKHGMPPHGGFGMGLERLTQKMLGLRNVKEASLFPRDINRLAP